jgi:hypothetical protein
MQHIIMLTAPEKKDKVFRHQMDLLKAIIEPVMEREKHKHGSTVDRTLSVRAMKILEDSRMKDPSKVPWHGNNPLIRK